MQIRFFVKNILALAIGAVMAGCGGGGGAADVAGAVATGRGTADASSYLPISSAMAVGTAGSAESVWALSPARVLASFDVAASDDTSLWKYSDNNVPTAYRGAVQQTTGSSGNGARLNFDFDCGQSQITARQANCGFAAEMRYTPLTPLSVSSDPSISFELRTPTASSLVTLRVHDSTGQVLSFPIDSRTIEAADGQKWAKIHVPVGRSTAFYGGANDGVLHGAIKAVAVVASTTGSLGYPRGHVAVDNIKLHADPFYSFSLRTDAPLAPGAFYPTYEGRLGVNIHTYSPEVLDKLNAVGIKLVRKGISWSYVERGGVFNYGGVDIWARALSSRGMSMLALLAYGHPDYGGATPQTDQHRQAFARYAVNTLNYLKRMNVNVTGFEVWNEPDVSVFWPNPDASSYARLLSQTVDSLRAADSRAQIISGGIGVLGVRTLNYYYELARSGVLNKVDGIGIHPYRYRAPETFAEDQAAIHQIRQQYGITAPLWSTEWGYSSYHYVDNSVYGDGHDVRAQRRQAVLTLRQVLAQLALNTKVMIVYNATDGAPNATDREANFGLFRQDLTEKPSMQALRTLWEVAQRSRTFKGFLPDVPAGLHVVRWDGSADWVFAVWSETKGVRGSITLPPGVTSVVRWDGAAISERTSLSLSEDDGPVFVTVRR